MAERPLEEASARPIRIGQLILLALLIVVALGVSFPIRIQLIHVGIIIGVAILLAEAYLSLSRRSILNDEQERRVNEFLVGLAEYPGAWAIKSIIKMAEKRNENLRRQRAIAEARRFLETTESIVAVEFGHEDWLAEDYDPEFVAEEIVSRSEHSGPFAIKEIISPAILDLPSDERRIVAMLIIVCQQKATTEDVYEHKEAISQCLENFDFTNPGESELKLLHGFNDLRLILDTEVADCTLTLEGEIDDPEQLYEMMMDNHYPFSKTYPAFDKITLREYKQNIAELVQAELSVAGAQSKILESIKEERERLKLEIGSRDTFLIAFRVINWEGSVDGYDDIDRPLAQKFGDHIKIGRTYTVDEDAEKDEDVRVNMWLVSVEPRYPSGEAFFHAEIEPILPDEVVGYATRINTPLRTNHDREELYAISESRELVDEIVSQADILFTGQQDEEITLRAIENMVDRNVSAEDLLAAIQLDSIADATGEESRAFAAHRGEIEETLGITSVFEWGDIDPEKASEKIDALVDTGDVERWTELSTSLVDTVQKCRPPGHADTA